MGPERQHRLQVQGRRRHQRRHYRHQGEERRREQGQGTGEGKGGDLDDPVLGNLTLPVTAQLINQPSNVCFEGVFDTQDVIKNEATQFKAKAQ